MGRWGDEREIRLIDAPETRTTELYGGLSGQGGMEKDLTSMVKAVLFDIDGVLINLPFYYSAELEKQGYTGAVSILWEYYKSHKDKLCTIGKLHIANELEPFLMRCGWHKPVESNPS